jgi:DNA-binding XRE family transcriptional regulator
VAPSLDPIPDHVLARRRRIGRQIRDARIDADLSQERLAELADMTRNSIVNIETGAVAALLDSLLMIADALRTPLSELVRE